MSFVGMISEKATFLGAIITEADTALGAVRKTWLKEINPGGQVMILEIPEDKKIDSKFLDKLLTKEELVEATGGPVTRLGDLDEVTE